MKVAERLDIAATKPSPNANLTQDKLTAVALRLKLTDLASATDMHLLNTTGGSANLAPHMEQALGLIATYPSRADSPGQLTTSVERMLKRWFDLAVGDDEIAIFNGVYGAYRTILLATKAKAIIVPELVPESHKRAFRTLGVKVIELPMCSHGRPDLNLLPALWKQHPEASWFYFTHTRGEVPPVKFFDALLPLLEQFNGRLMYDADIIYTRHRPEAQPWLPLTLDALRSRMIFLGTLSKEFGAPGLRIGYGIGEPNLMATIRRFQTASLEIIATPNQYLAAQVISLVDLNAVQDELRQRMQALVSGLNRLGWSVEAPSIGVNLFVPVPPSFLAQSTVPPDELFAFCLLKARVLARVGSTDGVGVDTNIRLTACQPVETINRVFAAMEAAGVSHDMRLPTGLIEAFEQL